MIGGYDFFIKFTYNMEFFFSFPNILSFVFFLVNYLDLCKIIKLFDGCKT